MIRIACTHCDNVLEIPQQEAGQKGTCDKCGAIVQTPLAGKAMPAYQPAQPTHKPQGNGLAIASLVLGVLSWIGLYYFTAIPAIIIGHLVLGKVKRNKVPQGSKGFAIAGLALGYVNMCLVVLIAVFELVGHTQFL